MRRSFPAWVHDRCGNMRGLVLVCGWQWFLLGAWVLLGLCELFGGSEDAEEPREKRDDGSSMLDAGAGAPQDADQPREQKEE